METVDILMATYNGAKYVDKQILSIIGQTYKVWRLIVHDDGSTDDTVEIIKRFCRADSRITYVEDGYSVKNAGLHFMYMLRFVESPYICFCDQDDIWLESKLERMVLTIRQKDNSIPQVIFSDAYLYHDSTSIIDGRLLFTRPHKLREILFTNGGVHGSASMFNRSMRNCINRQYQLIGMHDHILTLVGCSIGEITYLDDKLFLYRQHQNNVTGNMETSSVHRVINAFKPCGKKYTLSQSTIESVMSFLHAYKDELSPHDISTLKEYLTLVNMGPLKRFFKVVLGGYSLGNSRIHLLVKILTRSFFDKKCLCHK